MKTKLIFLFFFTISILSAQNCDYDALIREGRTFFNKSQFRPALKKFNAARTCDPSKSAEIDKEVDKVFDAIEAQREAAEENFKKFKEEQAQTMINSGDSYFQNDEFRLALTEYQKALELIPNPELTQKIEACKAKLKIK